MSFHQIAQNNALSLAEVTYFAEHFIYWRRAIAIPPLHPKDVYMVSPNCDLSKLPRAAAEWQRTFPTAPPLTSFLAELSVAPRPYKYFSPSKSHRPLYMNMLAWLMRGGWVTQLCTSAYVVVWPEIIYEVEYAIEAEEIKASASGLLEKQGSSSSGRPSNAGSDESEDAVSDEDEDAASASETALARSTDDVARLTLSSLLSSPSTGAPEGPEMQAMFSPSSPGLSRRTFGSTASLTNAIRSHVRKHHHHSTNTPPTTEQVAEQARLARLADRVAREAAEKAASHARKVPPLATRHPSTNSSPHLKGIDPHIILDAAKANGKESLYLTAIQKRLAMSGPSAAGGARGSSGTAAIEGERLTKAWREFQRYFNGRCALERIALLEDMKRKETWNLLTAMGEYLLTVRHW